MKCDTNEGPVLVPGEHPCSVCKKGVGRNSVYCSFCKNWVRKRCSGFKGRLIDTPDVKCHSCLLLPESDKKACKFKIGNSVMKEWISSAIMEICLVLVVGQKQAQ